MAQFSLFDDHQTLAEQLKVLEDDELLDFWEETQHLARMMGPEQCEQCSTEDPVYDPEYERLILMELQVRHCRRGASR